MAKFKKGDRVKVMNADIEDISMGIQKGDTGTVLEDDKYVPWVRMDKYDALLGNADGLCEEGHGTCFYEDDLELIEEGATTQRVMTPIQELIEYKHQIVSERGDELSAYQILNLLMLKAESMLEKEKEVMCQFQSDGQRTDFWVKYSDNEDSFNKTFKTK